MRRFLAWAGLSDGMPVEAATVDLTGGGLTATGTQIGRDPLPYRLDYTLDAAVGFVTRSITISVVGDGWRRQISLARDEKGAWTGRAAATGDTPRGVDLAAPGIEGDLAGALDCDLGLSPLTNAMPVLRHALHTTPVARDFLMDWVSVPELRVKPYPQRYEHLHREKTGSVVRFVDRGLFPGFVADLELDLDGLVRFYPHLSRRVCCGARPTRTE